MEEKCLQPGERLDDLIIQGLKIVQHEKEFCFTLDAVLLAHFAFIKSGAAAIDLGCGTGAVSLLLLARGADRVAGVEISPVLADMARRSAALNGLSDRFSVLQADFRNIKGILPGGECELVVSNPPYRPQGHGRINPNSRIAQARHEITATLADVVAAARYLVRYRGRFAMVHLPERMAEVITALRLAGLEPKRLRMVHSAPDRKPTIFLVESIRGAKPGLDVLPPFIVYNSDGTYTEEICGYYRQEIT